MLIITLIVAVFIYSLLVYYIGRSGWGFIIKPNPTKWFKWFKWFYIGCVVLLSTSFILGRIGKGTALLQVLGSYWMMIFCILLLLLPIVQISMWLLSLTNLPRNHVRQVAGIVILVTSITCITYGTFNAYSPVVREYQIEIKHTAL